jgi:hypothetical protein
MWVMTLSRCYVIDGSQVYIEPLSYLSNIILHFLMQSFVLHLGFLNLVPITDYICSLMAILKFLPSLQCDFIEAARIPANDTVSLLLTTTFPIDLYFENNHSTYC